MADEYAEYLAQTLDSVERLGDKFYGFDERVDFAVRRIQENSNKLSAVASAIDTIAQRLGVEVEITPRATEQIPYAATLAIAGLAGSRARIYELAPFDGYIMEVEIHWPDGCNGLVDVAVWHNNVQFCPREGYLHLNDATPKYKFNRDVNEGDELWVDMINGDGGNPHNISVTLLVQEK